MSCAKSASRARSAQSRKALTFVTSPAFTPACHDDVRWAATLDATAIGRRWPDLPRCLTRRSCDGRRQNRHWTAVPVGADGLRLVERVQRLHFEPTDIGRISGDKNEAVHLRCRGKQGIDDRHGSRYRHPPPCIGYR